MAEPTETPWPADEGVEVHVHEQGVQTLNQALSVGNIHMGAAAFGALIVSTVAAFLAWGGVTVPAEVLTTTTTLAGVIAGWVWPSD